jgi:hypothetical protein
MAFLKKGHMAPFFVKLIRFDKIILTAHSFRSMRNTSTVAADNVVR